MRRVVVTLIRIVLTGLLLGGQLGAAWPASAQDPVPWQSSAKGLRTQENSDRQTAGLGFIVRQESWPFVSLRGGVRDAGSWLGPRLLGPIGIELGQIKLPSGTGSFVSETADWSYNEMAFSNGSTQLKLTTSRLSAAILAQTTAGTLRMLAGSVSGSAFDGTTVTNRASAPSYPKYVAYSTEGNVQVRALSMSPLSLPTLDRNWVLVWYGSNSHFVDTKTPLSYEWSVPHTRAFQGDAPLLLVFQSQPSSVQHTPEGGIDIAFSGAAGNVVLLPLYGRSTWRASETEKWASSFPSSVKQQATWWGNHLCAFPASVSETYSYDGPSDIATIGETIRFIEVCSGGTSLAPLPPTLGIAKDVLGVAFSGPVVDGNLPTEFGPSMGIENTSQYVWRVGGLRKYTDSERVLTNSGEAPVGLTQELSTEVNKIMAGGHWAPWIFLDAVPMHASRGDLYWANPADVLDHLIEVAPAVPDQLQGDWISYIRSERASYPPEDVYDLTIQEGSPRQAFAYFDGNVDYAWRPSSSCGSDCPRWAHNTRVPLYNFYALARYYELTGDPVPPEVLQKAKAALDRDMREQDWATGYWFEGFDDFYSHLTVTPNANRHLAAIVGLVKLAKLLGDSEAENLGRALLAKAAVLRIGLAKFPRYMYSAGLVELPPDPAWQAKYTAGWWQGQLFNYSWTGPFDDPRQVAVLNQFGVFLHEHSSFGLATGPGDAAADMGTGIGYGYLTAYRYLVPETGRMLADYAKQDAEVYINKVKALFPHWYAAFAEGTLGDEHNLNHPMDSFQIFMADAWIENASPTALSRSADIPWLVAGDLFYSQKLAETIMAYRGIRWSDVPVPTTTFADVPMTHPYYAEIEALYRAGYTAGCNTNPLRYCPDVTMNRAESSVFVERGIHTASYDPPTPTSQVFADLALDSWAGKWVTSLWNDRYTAGCGTNPLVYCPWQGHTRAEACVFYLRMLRGANYEPPQPSQQTFVDVPLDAWYAKWVQGGYDASLITACQTTPELRFCPDDPLSRGLAAYMMVQAKGLPTP